MAESSIRQHLGTFVDGLDDVLGLDDLKHRFSSFLNAIGFQAFTYAGLRYASWSGDRRPVVSTFPKAWIKHYEDQHYEGIDPVLPMAARNLKPVLWDQLSDSDPIDRRQKSLFAEAKSCGLCHGITVPVHGQMGDFAIVSVASNLSEKEFQGAVRSSLHDIHIASLYYHDAVRRSVSEGATADHDSVKLTSRERECLLWTARGKTSWETAEILSLSENTVNFYIKSAMHKLGVFTKNHAVVRAIMMFLIFP